MDWRRMDDKKANLIVYSEPFDGFNRDEWAAMATWLSCSHEEAFSDPLASLNPKVRLQEEDGSV